MVREPDPTMQPAPQDIQLLSKHRVLSFKPQLRLEWRGQDSQNETEQPDHSASSGDSITSSTRIRFSVHTGHIQPTQLPALAPPPIQRRVRPGYRIERAELRAASGADSRFALVKLSSPCRSRNCA